MGYLTSKGTKKGGDKSKRGGGNINKVVKAARGSYYLTLDTKKSFNHLWHAFTQTSSFQRFDLKWHIRIETNTSGYTIDGVLS